MKTLAIVQARMGSIRFPGKMLQPILGKPMIEQLLRRLSQSSKIDRIVVATGNGKENDPLRDAVKALGYDCYRGDEEDVLKRFYDTAQKYAPSHVVRITGDCPLIDPVLVDDVISEIHAEKADYVSNVSPPTFPDGLDIEVFTFACLEKAHNQATEVIDREHVTPYIRSSGEFRCLNLENDVNHADSRWTVDDTRDMEVATHIFSHFAPDVSFSWRDVIALEKEHPELFSANKTNTRNAGSAMDKGPKLWNRAKQLIPGGNMLLSKRPEMFLPEKWPSYFSKAKGCSVWDLDGREYKDMSFMGIGTNTLGYGHSKVDEAVMQTIAKGNMSTLNCPEEVWLAEKLIEMHPWAQGVRFTRSGGEANSVAVRIARAASQRDGVAVCGYHGWHDWYLSANLGDQESLTGHLLPGLNATGVPASLRGTTFPFEYNDINEVRRLINEENIGVVKMEVTRTIEPAAGFLEEIRELTKQKNIVLIFDECTSGFRQTFGGVHKEYQIEPDMAVFGKTLGNGYAINAVIGRSEIMEHAQSSFISSTFWTERIGPTAALATLEVMEEINSWVTISNIGLQVRSRWQALADQHHLEISHFGLAALAGYAFMSENALAYKTYITQEMLKAGFLAGTSLYSSIAHDQETIDRYFEALQPIFRTISECEAGRNIADLLDGPLCHSGFQRLN